MSFLSKYFPHLLLAIYIVEILVLSISPLNRQVWAIEMLTVVPFVLILSALFIKKHILSNVSYLIIAILLYVQAIGAHFTFEHVPFDWFNDFFGFERNMYDRVGHFLVGFLAYPIIEVLIKYKTVSARWFAYVTAVAFVIAIAGLYEVYEWIYAINVNPVASIGFMGSQGDYWDTQKDMLMDTLGALFAVGLYFLVNRKRS